MEEIIGIEMERLIDYLDEHEIKQFDIYCDARDYNDEFSDYEIDVAQIRFIVQANKYFKECNLPYKASMGCESVLVERVA